MVAVFPDSNVGKNVEDAIIDGVPCNGARNEPHSEVDRAELTLLLEPGHDCFRSIPESLSSIEKHKHCFCA